jgi:transcriptional regulator with XRE-family HTH domain
MASNKAEQIWESLEDEEYRREFADDVATGLAFQVRALREKAGLTQEELARRIGKRQETISLWENPNYGNYTYKTLSALASAFDLVPVFRLGSFSEMVEWNANLTPTRIAPPSFDEENQARQQGWKTLWYGGSSLPIQYTDVNSVHITVNLMTGGSPTASFAVPAPAPESQHVIAAASELPKERTFAFAA